MKTKLLVAAMICLTTTSVMGSIASYKTWKRKALASLQAGSQIVNTGVGPVEYRISGKGPAVLIAHGTPGGYDQSFAFSKLLSMTERSRSNTMKHTFISLSRPGYLQTPLESGRTPAEQADLYASLLDELGIQQASIIGFSGGGPSALQFALRYPERCQKLAIISGVAQSYSEEELQAGWSPLQRWFSQFYSRLILFDPLLYAMLPFARLAPQAASEDLLRSVMMYSIRQQGYENDMEQFLALKPYPLAQIKASTFVLHGTADGEVPYADAELLASQIPNVQLVTIKNGGHQAFYTHARFAMPLLRNFLTQ
ncbi:alpha/beta fold hydrolase [Tengunoibacter tsumagoiensis]|uniref:Alpha/beta hydrolase n=1 Tax=Tengunoibacter tsumagoiensis TaxID=2014871 RepID=A0A401ZTV1_9CHLR|nr:alpha/beta hydrolase [Tengunoibacter tsumagoiensis]GCE10315.1 alpha/beta hydrolase [Tengunoibacter tsumagoiensis]